MLSIGLAACNPTQSYVRASDGSTVYIDQLSDAAKAEARQKIVHKLSQGITVYNLAVGDEVEIFFHISRKPTQKEYVISAGDKLQIDFLGDTENSRAVQVSPDGRISVPLIGPVRAAGQSADALARQLQERLGSVITEPKITVNVTETYTPLDDFIEVLGSAASTRGRSIVSKVLPDGTISVPLLPPLRAHGRALKELAQEIDAAYATKGLNIFVSLIPRTLRIKATLVIGEVSKPGRIEMDRPTTVLMAVAQAGGVLPAGSMSSVRVYYIGEDRKQYVRLVNLKEVMNNLRLEDDMIVPNNSIIYVPPTELTKTGRFMDAVVRDVLRFQGFSLGAGFQILQQENSGGGVAIFQTTPAK